MKVRPASMHADADPHQIPPHAGCICCTLREDLLIEVARLASEGRFDYLLIESPGISEPMPVAATFLFEDIDGESLSSLARLDTMASVVDAATFLDRCDDLEELTDLGVGRDDEDDRSVIDLVVDQVEFASVIVISKPDLVTEEHLEKVVDKALEKVAAENVVRQKLQEGQTLEQGFTDHGIL